MQCSDVNIPVLSKLDNVACQLLYRSGTKINATPTVQAGNLSREPLELELELELEPELEPELELELELDNSTSNSSLLTGKDRWFEGKDTNDILVSGSYRAGQYTIEILNLPREPYVS
jgi:hypothetical protein